MPIIVGILTCISRINTRFESLKGRKDFYFFSILVYISSCNYMLSSVEHEKGFTNSWIDVAAHKSMLLSGIKRLKDACYTIQLSHSLTKSYSQRKIKPFCEPSATSKTRDW